MPRPPCASSRASSALLAAAHRTRARMRRGAKVSVLSWPTLEVAINPGKFHQNRTFSTAIPTGSFERLVTSFRPARDVARVRYQAHPSSVCIRSLSSQQLRAVQRNEHYRKLSRHIIVRRAPPGSHGLEGVRASSTLVACVDAGASSSSDPVPCNGSGGSFQRWRQVSMTVSRAKNIHACVLVLFSGSPVDPV